MRDRAGKWMACSVGAIAIACAFVACGLDDSVVVSLGAPDASIQEGGGASKDAATIYDSGGDATIGTTICTSLTLCDDGGGCGGGSACTPPIPSGWSLVGFDPGANVACGGGYATQDSFIVVDGGGAQCSCLCNAGTAPSCTNLQAVLTTGAACNSGATTQNVTETCQPLAGAGFTPTNAGALQVHLQPLPDTCAPQLSKTFPPWDAGVARECNFGGDGGEFCSGHSTCVASSGAPHSVCITQPYSGALPPTCVSSCPAGFTSSCEAVADTIADTRDCSACTCAWNNVGCTVSSVTFAAAGNCTGSTTSISPDTCASTTITTIGGMQVNGAAATSTCGKTADTSPSGSVMTGAPRVVCCAN